MLYRTFHSTKFQVAWLITIIAASLLFSLSLIIGSTNPASASNGLSTIEYSSALSFQATPTSTLTLQIVNDVNDVNSNTDSLTYSASLTDLGYSERSLVSPYGDVEYSFIIPENWVFQDDGLLNLDLSYTYDQVDSSEIPAFFGDMRVTFNGQTLETFPINESELDHFQLSIPIPLSLLTESNRPRHRIEVLLDADLICDIPHKAQLIIHPTSFLRFPYETTPLVPDLSRYPRPFSQSTHEETAAVRFVLPEQPNIGDINNAASVIAKLGDLTGAGMVISATTDSELIDLLADDEVSILDEHYIVVGSPQENQFLRFLDDITELPVSLRQRRLSLITQGPATIAPGEIFTYTFTINNTIDQNVTFSMVNPLSPYAEFIDCTLDCRQEENNNQIFWDENTLAPTESINFSLTLQAAEVLTGTIFENTIFLTETDLGPINVDTITTTMVISRSSNSNASQISTVEDSEYFFMYNDQAVSEEDGIVQEILSPWSENRAILIVTGSNDRAVQKAAQAMSSESRFPGMSGEFALVKDVLTSSDIFNNRARSDTEFTFSELGYEDEILEGLSTQQIDYFFNIPHGWLLTDDAAVDLYFYHSQLIDYDKSELSIRVNRRPAVSVRLNEETIENGHVRINLSEAYIEPGQNRLSVRTDMSLGTEGLCVDPESDQAWLVIQNSSKVFLPHIEQFDLNLNFDRYPYPFQINLSMTDLLFVLPNMPSISEIENALALVAALGDSAGGKTLLPEMAIADSLENESLESHHIIAIGRPTRNRLIQQVNSQLPQPFIPGTDEIEQRLDDVTFRLPSGTSLGYVQLVSSPWNETQAFLAVTGTTDESVNWAASIPATQPWLLDSGDLALVRDEGVVETFDTRDFTEQGRVVVMATAIPEMSTAITTTISPTNSLSDSSLSSTTPTRTSSPAVVETERPVWLMPLVGITGATVIAIFGFAFWQARRKISR